MSWNQECSECRSCPASSWHRRKCADEMDQQFEKDMMDEMERRYLNELQFDEYLQSLKQTVKSDRNG